MRLGGAMGLGPQLLTAGHAGCTAQRSTFCDWGEPSPALPVQACGRPAL